MIINMLTEARIKAESKALLNPGSVQLDSTLDLIRRIRQRWEDHTNKPVEQQDRQGTKKLSKGAENNTLLQVQERRSASTLFHAAKISAN